MHVTAAQSTNLESVPVNQQQSSIALGSELHATTAESSSNSDKNNSRNSKKTALSTTGKRQEHGNLDDEVSLSFSQFILLPLHETIFSRVSVQFKEYYKRHTVPSRVSASLSFMRVRRPLRDWHLELFFLFAQSVGFRSIQRRRLLHTRPIRIDNVYSVYEWNFFRLISKLQ
jgi:hypothetical protein